MQPIRSFPRLLAVLLCFSLLPLNPKLATGIGKMVEHQAVVPATDVAVKSPAAAVTPMATPTTGAAAVALAAFPSFPGAVQAAGSAFAPLGQTDASTIQITDNGFAPATLTIFGPTDVTWINNSATTHTLQSGEPDANPTGDAKLFLPLVTKGSPSAVAAAMNYLQALRQQVNALADFSATLAPGQTFTYRFTKPGNYKFYLSTAPQVQGELALTGTALLRTSPSSGEDGVAATRETILEFSGPLDPATVTTAAFTARAGSRALAYRLNLSPDKTRVTLFYNDPLPGSARVRVDIAGDKLKDAQGGTIDVDGDGVAGGTLLLEFDTLSLTVVPGTQVCGRVFASELAVNASNVSVNTPLAGVTISVAGMEAALNAQTDANGNFCLNPAPSGRFFVHIDGLTATNSVPAGAYYPFVGKLWQSVPGQQTNVGDAYLPLIVPGTLQSVSAEADTLITFPDTVLQGHPEFEGVMITVPANALFNDDGSRGGKVGLAPVPPDRLPGQLPEGLDFPVVITVQSDGASNFDTPAPVCFPNLPDPNTGKKLEPGAKDALYSFNHDTGSWETVGSMTVSADGQMVCSDPGVGIRAPGWHGSGPPPKEPPPPPPPPCQNGKKPNPALLKCVKRATEDMALCTGAAIGGGLVCIALSLGGCAPVVAVAGAACAAKGGLDLTRCQEDNPSCITALAVQQTQNTFPYLRVDTTQTLQAEIIDQILAIHRQIQELIYPYVIQGQSAPDSVQAQVNTLTAQANALAGGNAAAYLQDYVAQQDQQLIQRNNPGNAPAYPILYAAAVHRPSGTFYLRGKSGPAGQYSLMVPRDGTLLYINFYDPLTNAYGIVFPHVTPNAPYSLPNVYLNAVDSSFADFDQDTLADVVELVYGTDAAKADTDDDGINDGAEVAQGTDPLGGFITQTGIIGSADTPGTAVDLCVQDDLAVVADADAGVAVFNVFDNQNPKLIAQVETPGDAQRVACAGGHVAVADYDRGLALLDISNATSARITQQLDLAGNVTAVAALNTVAYAATETGRIVAVAMSGGTIIGESQVDEGVQDLAVQGEMLYVLTTQKLYAFELHGNTLTLTGAAAAPGTMGGSGRAWRLFVGGKLAYASHIQGYNTFDLTMPGQPELIQRGETAQFGWKQIVTNGANIGVAAVGLNSSDDGPHHISLYDVSDPQQTDNFITQFETPGLARAVALYNGRAYVADSEAGLAIINYLAYDSQKVPPQVTISTNYSAGKAEEGTLLRITADTTDDRQVHSVEFYMDGQLAATDGSFPFEARLVTPRRADQLTFTLRVRAIDTGGNQTWSEEQMLTLTQDATPPRVTAVTPANGLLGEAVTVKTLTATFNEAIAPTSVTSGSFQLFTAGPDQLLGTADDIALNGGVVAMPNPTTVTLTFNAGLPADRYRAVLTTGVTDVAGNPLSNLFAWAFQLAPVIQIGDVVTGVIAPAEENFYYLTATPGQQVFFDIQAYETIYATWRLIDSTGTEIFDSGFWGQQGVVTLAQGGLYTLVIKGLANQEPATYQFQLWHVPSPQRFTLQVGDTVADGSPAAGAGKIESPGVKDIYHFTATPGQPIFFDLQAQIDVTYLQWRLTDSTGAELFNKCLGCGQVGVQTLTQGGTYTLTVGNDNDASIGTYQFQLWHVPSPQRFTLQVGDTVADGSPAAGAGKIESPGTKDIYQFTATPGQQIFFDLQEQIDVTYLQWRLTDSTGAELFNKCLGCGQGGVQTLTQGGTYTLTVGNDNDASIGTYQFQLWDVPAPQRFTIQIGDTVADGSPAAGAGKIESPGTKDIYQFTATAGQRVLLNLQTAAPQLSQVAWQLTDSTGAVLFDTCLGCSNPAVQTLTQGGLYTLTVGDDLARDIGVYQFQISAQ